MSAPRWAALLPWVLACGGRVDPTQGGTSTGTTGASTSEGTSGGEACTPVAGAAIEREHRRGDPGMPEAGDAVEVARGLDDVLVAAMTDRDEADDDVLVTAFGASGAVGWSTRYEGMAGLEDTALDVVADPDGSVYVLLREQISERITEGYDTRNRWTLVVLAIGPQGEHRWRYVATQDPEGDVEVRAGGLVIDGDGRLVMLDVDAGGADSGPPSFIAFDRHGNIVTHVELGTPLSGASTVALAAAADGDVVAAVGSYAERWIARLGADGAVRWEHRDEVDDGLVSGIAVGGDDVAWTLLSTGDVEAGTAGFALHRHDPAGVALPVIEHGFEDGSGYAAGLVIDCDGTAIVAAETGLAPARQAEISAVADDGTILWSARLQGPRPLAPRSIAALGDGGLAVGGLDGEDLGPWLARLAGP